MKALASLFLALWLVQPLRAQDVPLSLPDTTVQGAPGMTVALPLRLTASVTGRGLVAFEFRVWYAGAVLNFAGVRTAGTLLAGWSTAAATRPGPNGTTEVTITGASTTPIAGGPATLLWLDFVVLKQGQTTPLTLEGGFNEGVPRVIADPGSLLAPLLPPLSLSPSTVQLVVGESQQVHESGGVSPVWSLADPGVATVTSGGVVTAVSPGRTVLRATAGGGMGEAVVDVRFARLQVTSASMAVGDTVTVDLTTTALDAFAVRSGGFSLSLSGTAAEVVGIETRGTLLDGVPVYAGTGRAVALSWATTTNLGGSGVLIRFRLKGLQPGSTSIVLQDAVFNEILEPYAVAGSVQVQALPTLGVSPASATVVAGESVAFTAWGGTAPYTWATDDPSVATIDGAGRLTGHRGGTTVVTVTSADGGMGRTQAITVLDGRVEVVSTVGAPGTDIDVPVVVSSLAGRAFSAVELTFAYDDGVLQPLSPRTTGSALDGWTVTTRAEPGRLVVVAAGTQAHAGDETLVWLRFRVVGARGQTATVRVERAELNEGSPSVAAESGTVHVYDPLLLDVRVLLDGARTSTTMPQMRTSLGASGLLPVAQPYTAAPWNYNGLETAQASLLQSGQVVDWVLVELRAGLADSTTVRRVAALLTADGYVRSVGAGGTSLLAALSVGGLLPGYYYMVVRHRNHLPVMSASAVYVDDLSARSVDFTAAEGAAYGTAPQRMVTAGIYALWGGDGNGSQTVSATDRTVAWRRQNGQTGYLSADYTLNGAVSATDYTTVWRVANGRLTQVPR